VYEHRNRRKEMENEGQEIISDNKYCEYCGEIIHKDAVVCPKCGRALGPLKEKLEGKEGASEKSRLVAILLCWFLGVFGIHRFYVGRIGTGILWLFTFGLAGIGSLVDLILIAAGTFKDKEGNKLLLWNVD